MSAIGKFGENVQGYTIPVLNEREIRAAAGLMFLATLLTFMIILFNGNFVPVKYLLLIFLTDFSIRIFINPKYSPILIIGRLIVHNQNPEYVGAIQKKFAWYIGFVLSAIMFTLLVVVNAYSFITGIICLLCLILMFFETAFGICLGCIMYKVIYKEKAQYCPGEVCDVKNKQAIQKTSKIQLIVLLSFIAFICLTAFFLNEKFKEKPFNLFEKSATK
ncbi:MAG: DUF4395 domain-containing protein [Ferruginibacter sp.]